MSILEIRSMFAAFWMLISNVWLVLVMSSSKLISSVLMPSALKLNVFALAVSGLKLRSPIVEDMLL